ncbi:FkbM family methyltransferase [Methylocystis echinoides]|uniref:FkbM family methyltransferase n=1 Tax=Methylocystis echinoides TaxID=29468 RepID=UPI0024938179|nr:FkbM family methyltransferase [Methylocystis echinoides]
MPKIFDEWFVRYMRSSDHPAKLRLIDLLLSLRRTRIRVTTEFGIIDVDSHDLIQKSIMLNGAYEPATLSRILSLVNPSDTFVDVGANMGQFSLAVAKKLDGNGRVIAIEPNPEICSELMHNCTLNPSSNVISIACVAADAECELLRFGIPVKRNRGTSRQVNDDFAGAVFVLSMNLGELLEKINVERVRLMKIDTEGSELRILTGLLSGSEHLWPDNIIFEFLPEDFSYGGDPNELPRFVADKGYLLHNIDGSVYQGGVPLQEGNLWARRVYK